MEKTEKQKYKEAYDVLKEEGAIENKKNNLSEGLIEISLPKKNRLISTFIKDMAPILKESNRLFYRKDLKEIVEVGEIKDEEEEYVGFLTIRPPRFITLIEKYLAPGYYLFNKDKNEFEFIKKSMGSDLANTILQSPQLQENLPTIKRLFSFQIPIIYNGKLTFPKEGYDERFKSWLPKDSPKIIDDKMEISEAKEIIDEILEDFCFRSEKDKINAIAGMITPFLRGLFKNYTNRTPVFFYEANRERAGKDYLAGITGMIYEGYSLEEPPISNGELKNSGSSEELRKKILGALIGGRRRLHFANNKGYINNAVFESVTTAEKYSDRPLGKSEVLTLDNELDFSLSGNVGIGYTPDFANRCRFIRLFLDIEDANKRFFSKPNLHGWVKENRERILSAFFSLVKNWINNGMIKGKVPFASFPEWSRVCGGIMESAGLGNPCEQDIEILSLGGDDETKDMKRLFELCFEKYPDEWLSKQRIRAIVIKSEEEIFANLDLDRKGDQMKFGFKLKKFEGRVLSDIRLKVKDNSVRSSRQEYKFNKEIGNLGNLGSFGPPIEQKQKSILYKGVDSCQSYQGYQKTIKNDVKSDNKCEGCGNQTKNIIKGVFICDNCAKTIPGELK